MTTTETKAVGSEQALALYNRVHPEYAKLKDHWEFCNACYIGGQEWFAGNIHRYHKEGDQEYAARLQRATRINHTREVVDLIQKYIFKSPIARDASAGADVQAFWKKATRDGRNVGELMAEVSTATSVCQRVAVVVDTETGPVVTLSQAEAEEHKRAVYAYVVMPWDILDYSFSKTDGKLNWIKLREWVRDDEDPLQVDMNMIERQRLWTRDGWMLFSRRVPVGTEKDGGIELKDMGRHDLGEVPVRLVDHISLTGKPYRSAGLVDDVAYLDRQVANYLSDLDAIIQDQTFSQLAIPAESLPSDQKGAKKNMLEFGTKRVFTYSAGIGSSARPEFLSPDPKQAGVIQSTIDMIVAHIYSTIGLAGERTKQDNAVGIDNSSGVAKAYDFERVNALLLSKAQRLQAVENWLAEMVRKWNGERAPNNTDLVTYPDSFDVATLGDELVTAQALQKIEAPIELRREQMREILAKLLPATKDETWKKLNAAIDKWDVQPKVAPGMGQPGAGGKPAGAPNRQGSVTAKTPATPKTNAK
ncbi:hypothetical protein [Paracoccus litorisediminis]|uniref:Phage portal protein, SPP1 Gp6-like n=1 Tax=Paracoccus litorisediminis TaxID=2006130 RepID=A0A844HRY3_9RHOB|nr:hypothetical protein [Paracoccus litorisediminis]MTH61194.1 hypothetical protein [Paracoccus litorisediminis]